MLTKPHLFRSFATRDFYGKKLAHPRPFWMCEGRGVRAGGRTPKQAFFNWQFRVEIAMLKN